jgi:hypothetical protein
MIATMPVRGAAPIASSKSGTRTALSALTVRPTPHARDLGGRRHDHANDVNTTKGVASVDDARSVVTVRTRLVIRIVHGAPVIGIFHGFTLPRGIITDMRMNR